MNQWPDVPHYNDGIGRHQANSRWSFTATDGGGLGQGLPHDIGRDQGLINNRHKMLVIDQFCPTNMG